MGGGGMGCGGGGGMGCGGGGGMGCGGVGGGMGGDFPAAPPPAGGGDPRGGFGGGNGAIGLGGNGAIGLGEGGSGGGGGATSAADERKQEAIRDLNTLLNGPEFGSFFQFVCSSDPSVRNPMDLPKVAYTYISDQVCAHHRRGGAHATATSDPPPTHHNVHVHCKLYQPVARLTPPSPTAPDPSADAPELR